MRKIVLLLLLALPAVADATVTTTTRTVSYVGSGGTTFAIPFPVLAATDIKVTKTTIATGSSVVLTQGVDYSVRLPVGSVQGQVTTTVTISSSYRILIERIVPLTQPVSFRTQGTFNPKAHEDAFDRCVMQIQQLAVSAVDGTDVTAAIEAHEAESDPHTGYAKLAGRAGGQTLNGGNGFGQNLVLYSNPSYNGYIKLGGGGSYWLKVDEAAGITLNGATSATSTIDATGAIRAIGGLYGNSTAAQNLVLGSTSHATKGKIRTPGDEFVVDETNNRVGINVAAPTVALDVLGTLKLADASDALTLSTTAKAGVITSGVTDSTLLLSAGSSGNRSAITLNGSASANPADTIIWGRPVYIKDYYPGGATVATFDATSGTTLPGDLTVSGTVNLNGTNYVGGSIYGKSIGGGTLKLYSTSHATKGQIMLGGLSTDYWDETSHNLFISGSINGRRSVVTATIGTIVTATDCGAWIANATDNGTVTLPNIDGTNSGCTFTYQATGATGATLISMVVHSSDDVAGSCSGIPAPPDAGGEATITAIDTVDGKGLQLPKATQIKGDYVTVTADATKTWWIQECMGDWVSL